MTLHSLSLCAGRQRLLARTGSCLSCFSKNVIGYLFSIWTVSIYRKRSLFIFLLEGNAELQFYSLRVLLHFLHTFFVLEQNWQFFVLIFFCARHLEIIKLFCRAARATQVRKVLCKVDSVIQSIQDEQRVTMSCINHTWNQKMGLAWWFVQLQNNLLSKQTKIYFLRHSACWCLFLSEYPLGVNISHWHVHWHSILVSRGGLFCF